MELLELQFRKQRPLNYPERYVIQIITDKYLYELVYRFKEGERIQFSGMISTYGHIHRRFHGITTIESREELIEHAQNVVERHEKLMPAEPAAA
jgi:hypothetical protein